MEEILLPVSKKTGKPYVPHPFQRAVHESKARFRIVIAGRRWGKTVCALMDLIDFMLNNSNSVCYWVVPLYKHLIPVSEAIREWIPDEFIAREFHMQQTFRYLELQNGSCCWFHSSENPDSLRGAGLDYVVLEEAAQLKENVWWEIILPEITDTGGKALIISTPKGKNWLYQEYLKARSGLYPEYEAWQRPSSDRVGKEELESARRKMPADIFRQEFLAEFVEGGGEVFRNVRACFKGEIDHNTFNVIQYKEGERIVPKGEIQDYTFIGVDIGRFEAFTVFTALDETGRLVGFERFRQLDFPYQKKRLISFLQHFPRRIVVADARGMGESFIEELMQENIAVEGVKLTNPLKNELITNLALKLDEEMIHGPYIECLVNELEAFSYHLSPSGNIVYSAPEGMQDDCVMSLAFAASKLHKGATDWIVLKGKGYLEVRGQEQ